MLEEVPHALAGLRLVVDQLTKASKTLISALGLDVVKRSEDGLLKHGFKLWV